MGVAILNHFQNVSGGGTAAEQIARTYINHAKSFLATLPHPNSTFMILVYGGHEYSSNHTTYSLFVTKDHPNTETSGVGIYYISIAITWNVSSGTVSFTTKNTAANIYFEAAALYNA